MHRLWRLENIFYHFQSFISFGRSIALILEIKSIYFLYIFPESIQLLASLFLFKVLSSSSIWCLKILSTWSLELICYFLYLMILSRSGKNFCSDTTWLSTCIIFFILFVDVSNIVLSILSCLYWEEKENLITLSKYLCSYLIYNIKKVFRGKKFLNKFVP